MVLHWVIYITPGTSTAALSATVYILKFLTFQSVDKQSACKRLNQKIRDCIPLHPKAQTCIR